LHESSPPVEDVDRVIYPGYFKLIMEKKFTVHEDKEEVDNDDEKAGAAPVALLSPPGGDKDKENEGRPRRVAAAKANAAFKQEGYWKL
jgi:hypothetical protein